MLDALDEALRAGFVAGAARSQRLAFVHDLVRDALDGQLSAAAARPPAPPRRERARRARRARAGALAGPARPPCACRRPGRCGAGGRATHWMRRDRPSSGWRGRTRSSCSSAPRHLRAAGGAARRLAEVLVALGDARLRAGETDVPGRVRGGGAARTRRATTRSARARGARNRGSRSDGRLGRRAVDRAPRGGARALGPEPSALRVRVLSRLAIALAYAPAEERRRALVTEAVATARSAARSWRACRGLTASHVVHWAPEHLRARLAVADELVGLGERADDAEIELHGRHWRVVDLLERGDVAAAESEIVRYERLAAEARLPAFSWYVPAWRAALAGYRGDLAAARRLADQAHAQGTRVRRRQRGARVAANHYTQWVVQEAWSESTSATCERGSLAGGSLVPGQPRALPGRARRRRSGARAAGRGGGRGPRAHAARRQPPDRPRAARRGVRRASATPSAPPRSSRCWSRSPTAWSCSWGNRARRLGRTAAWPRPGGGRTNGRSDRRARGRDLGRSCARRGSRSPRTPSATSPRPCSPAAPPETQHGRGSCSRRRPQRRIGSVSPSRPAAHVRCSRPLRPGLQHEVERRLGRAANRGEARRLEHPAQRGLPRLRAERRRSCLRRRSRAEADQCRVP